MKAKLKQIYRILFCILFFILPFEGELRIVPNLVLITLAVLFPFVVKKNHFTRLKNKGFLLFLLLYTTIIILLLFNNQLINSLFIVKKIPIVFAIYIFSLPISSVKTFKKSFLFGVFAAIIISLVGIIHHIIEQGEFLFSVGDVVNQVLITERVYLAYMVVISLVLATELLNDANKILKQFLVAFISISILFLLLIAARMALISCVIIMAYNLLFLKKYKTLMLAVFGGTILASIAFTLNNNLKTRFLFSDKELSFRENLKKWEPRIEIWDCAFQAYKSTEFNKLIGFSSFKKTNIALLECYQENIKDKTKKAWFEQRRYNTHNQFLDFLLSTGYIGLLLFVSVFVMLFYQSKNNRFNTSLLIACLLLSLVENFFHRQIGVYLFALILISVSMKDNIIETKKQNE